MTQTPLTTALVAHVTLNGQSLRTCLDDTRPDVVAAFAELAPAERQQFAMEGWTIGVRALLNVRAQAQQAHLGDIGKALVADLQTQLEGQLKAQEHAVTSGLHRYFDPENGQINERLRAFLADNGVLESTLRRFVAGDSSVLAQTLAGLVGERSELFRMLSPSDSQGLVQVLQRKVTEALEAQHDELQHALDPLQKDGAVGRFLSRLREEIEAADKDRGDQLARVIAALDANDDSSLLSRMVKESRDAHASLQRAINLQLPDSPLSTVKRTLEDMLSERLHAQKERFDQLQGSNEQLHKEIREAVARIETRRHENARAPRGGTDFEFEALAFAQRITPTGICTFEATGNTIGRRPRCKIGDAVIRFSAESAFAGSAVVIEVKRDGSYSVPAALQELDDACANRAADIGLFIMAKSHACDGFPGFARYGSKLLVSWEPDDPTSDGLLHGAIVAALALAQRRQCKIDGGDIDALADVEQRLVKELKRIAEMDGYASNIQRDAGKISDELRKARKALERVITDAQSTLTALNVELRDEAAEVASPIEVKATSANRCGDYSSADRRVASEDASAAMIHGQAAADGPYPMTLGPEDDREVDAAEE